ncbi:MAG: YigZ family protein [Chloroflexi bacterium]|nr:YigZ family protein [Chloroflexota bacterium]
MERAFRTLHETGRSEIEIKRSRFLGIAEPVHDEAGFQDLLARVRAAHPEASHHAFAYRLGREGETARFSDAGEPGGTAGRPMMEVLIREEVVDAGVVVTRYFGGTLLGSGGLTRAYGQTAAEAIRAAGFARMRPHTEMLVTIDYGQYGGMEQALQRANLGVSETTFTDTVSLVVRVPAGEEDAFTSMVADLTAGVGLVEPGKTVFLPE